MINKVRKSRFKKIFFNQKFLSLVGLIVIILISFPFAKNAIKQYRINKEISDFKKEIAELQSKNINLQNLIPNLESDQFVEEYARLNLNLKKPGENKTVIETPANSLNSASSSSGNSIFNIPGYKKEEPRQVSSNPQKWLNYFLQ